MHNAQKQRKRTSIHAVRPQNFFKNLSARLGFCSAISLKPNCACRSASCFASRPVVKLTPVNTSSARCRASDCALSWRCEGRGAADSALDSKDLVPSIDSRNSAGVSSAKWNVTGVANSTSIFNLEISLPQCESIARSDSPKSRACRLCANLRSLTYSQIALLVLFHEALIIDNARLK